MCVCMAPEYTEVNGSRNLSGEERHKSGEVTKVYTRKNRKPKLRAASPSANDQPSLCSLPAKNRISGNNYVVEAAQGEDLEGQDRNFEEEQTLKVLIEGLKSKRSKIGIEKVHKKSGGSANALPNGVTELFPTGGGEVEDRTKSHGEESGEHIHTSSRQENSDDGQQFDICGGQEPSVGEGLRGGLLEGQPDGLEMVSDHSNERRSDEAVEPSAREEIQPSSCEAVATNNKEELKQLANGRVDLQPNVGQVQSPSGTPGINTCGQDIHVNHLAPNVLENGVSKPLISRDGDNLVIALSKSNSQDELQSLKRKLEIDLDQVRRVKRKLEEKEFQVAAYNNVRTIPNGAGYTGSIVNDFSVYDQPLFSTRVSSSVGLVACPETRPFRHLSVSVAENNHDFAEFVEKDKRTPKANPLYTSSEFYLEKDRLPPESHKKSKGHGAGRKHRREGEYGLALAFGVDQDGDKLFKNCSNLLERLKKHKHGWVFNSPVDPIKLNIPDYHDIIKHPMDLGTIRTRLAQNRYKSAMEFAEDVRLVFYNAMTYNPKGQDVHTMAEELLSIFETRWASIENGYLQKKMYNGAVYFPARMQGYQPRPVLAPLTIPAAQVSPSMKTFDRIDSIVTPNSVVRPASYSAPRVRTPAPLKPKAKDPNKRDMTNDEKQKLSTNLQSLPAEKLDAIVQIIKKRSSALSQHDDEIEVDIDSVDAETLWELDRFVSNYKKSLSKYKRKAELAEKARIAAAQAIPATNPMPVALDSQKESTAVGGDVSAAPIQVEGPTNNSPSSSSSSSSSDSGSSSSDSDSDSSSDESDAGPPAA